MINAIIFSKDRASQLHLLLKSINKNANGIFNLNVIYTHSNDEFKSGYEKLIKYSHAQYSDKVNFIKESSFKSDVMALFKPDEFKFTCFFTDDDILFNIIDEETIANSLSNEDIFCFSLRLGENTTFCYTMNQENKLVLTESTDNTIVWDWQKSYMDFGYPLSVDGHIFRTKDIMKLSKAVGFVNPNTYEAALQVYETYPRHLMESYKHSKLVGVPVNVVQNVFPNKQGEKFGVSAKDLNDKFLSDNFVDFTDMDFTNVIGCHQEILFSFKKH